MLRDKHMYISTGSASQRNNRRNDEVFNTTTDNDDGFMDPQKQAPVPDWSKERRDVHDRCEKQALICQYYVTHHNLRRPLGADVLQKLSLGQQQSGNGVRAEITDAAHGRRERYASTIGAPCPHVDSGRHVAACADVDSSHRRPITSVPHCAGAPRRR